MMDVFVASAASPLFQTAASADGASSSSAYVYLALGFVALGFIVLALEIFIPSGVVGTVGGAMIITGIVFGFLSHVVLGIVLLVVAVIGVPLLIWKALQVLPGTPIGKHLVLKGPADHEQVATLQEKELKTLMGKEGVAISRLHPVGIAEIEGRRHQVVSEGQMVEEGTRIRVMDVTSNRILLRPLRDDEDTRSFQPDEPEGEESA